MKHALQNQREFVSRACQVAAAPQEHVFGLLPQTHVSIEWAFMLFNVPALVLSHKHDR